MKKILTTVLYLLVCMIFVRQFPASAEEIVRQGAYVLHRAAVPEKWVTGIAAPEMVQAHFPGMAIKDERFLGREGRGITLFREADNEVVKITLAVYETVAEAEDVALAALKKASANLPANSKNGQTIGTHSWYEIASGGRGAVFVVYYNVFFRIAAVNYSLAEEQAFGIVNDLKRGQNGVRLGKKVVVPRVNEISLDLSPQADGSWLVSHTAKTGQGLLLYRVSASSGSMMEIDDKGKFLFRPSEQKNIEFTVFAIDDLNVVSAVYTKKRTVE